MLGVACLTIRPNTERPITITEGTNRLVTPASLPRALAEALREPPTGHAPALWDGHASERVAEAITAWSSRGRRVVDEELDAGRLGHPVSAQGHRAQ